jgi:signal transduction histidine kinase
MFTSLYSKLASVLLVLFILVGITFVLVSVYSTEMYQQEVNQKLNHKVAKLIVSEKIIMRNNRVNHDALKEIFHMLMVINPSIEVYLLDPAGQILAFSAKPGKVKRASVDVEPIKHFLSGNAIFPFLGDDPRGFEKKKVFTAARIPEEGRLEGYLYVILGGEIYDSVIQKLQGSYIFRLSTWVIVISLVVAILTGLLIFASLTRRLRRLDTAIDAYQKGTPLQKLDLPEGNRQSPRDEIDRLVSTFRHMAGRIEEQVESLKNVDTMRRELVANVSHDLRTPLATLQGYVETLMIKDNTLNPEERKSYLETAVKHCNRLSSLVSDLFELAKLEAQDSILHREPFSLSELVQDVVQKFRLSAQEKNIAIEANIGTELPFVYADIGLIERALENLLGNALRHTPKNGSVRIALSKNGKNVMVRITDTGHGIPGEEISLIFDRFYQAGKDRGGRSGRSGLGLAITRRILELHESDIDVQSTVNVGTTFTFDLPAYQL